MVDLLPSGSTGESFDSSISPAGQQFRSRREARQAQGSLCADTRPPRLAPPKPRLSETAPVRTSATQHPRKNPLSVLVTMTVVGGMLAVAGLPAYAFTTGDSATQQAAGDDAQSTVVGEAAAAVSLSRDGYRATSPEEMAEMSRDEVRAQNNAEYIASGARALGDDYPWYYELADYQGGGLSVLNYYYRQCTDFVAWRLNRDQGSYAAPFKWVWSNLTPTGGNASQWRYAWDQHGWPVSTTPIVGSVAWFGYANHVAYVKAVLPDGNVVIEEYNFVPSVYSQRTIPASSVQAFLYPPTS